MTRSALLAVTPLLALAAAGCYPCIDGDRKCSDARPRGQAVLGACTPVAVSGTVAGAPATGVTVAYGEGETTTTDAAGRYDFQACAGTYTLTPASPGYAFTPPSRAVDVESGSAGAQDFVAETLPGNDDAP